MNTTTISNTVYIIFVIVYALITAFMSAEIGDKKGYSYIYGFITGFLFGIFSLIYYAGLPNKQTTDLLTKLIELHEHQGPSHKGDDNTSHHQTSS